MKKVSTLFDALRNEKFAIAVQDDYGIKYYGSEGQSREWSDWANSFNTKTLDANNLPAGIIQGPYKNISEHSLKSLLTAFGNNVAEMKDSFTDSKAYSYKSSVRMDNGARVPAVMDTPIGHFTKSQYASAVNYKGLAIRTQIKEGSFLFEAKVNNYAFNFENWMYNSTPSKAEIKSLRNRIDTNVGRSSERRLGMKLKAALIETEGRHRVGYAQTLETKSLEDSMELKGIGERIGGGARIGRRAARSMAMFDPKAWDGDGDGIVQEGTPFERPAIPGVNDKTTGGVVDVNAAKKAWKASQKTPSSSGTPRESSPRRRVPGSKPAERQVLTTRPQATTGRKIPDSKPIKRSGLASRRTQDDIDKEVSKQVMDMGTQILYKKSTTDELRSLVNALGPNGATELSGKQENEIYDIIDTFENGEYENLEDFLSELAVTLEKKPAKTQNQSGMRSRVGKAQMDRQVQGLASRSGRSKAKSKLKAVPGRDAVDEKDGSLWASLTPEQQDVVKKNTQAAYEGLQTYIKKDKFLSTWWDDFLRLPRKKKATDADGKPWSEQSRIAGEAFTSFEVALNGSLNGENSDIAATEAALAAQRPTLSDDEIKKIERRIANKKRQVQRLQKVLDDLKTYDQMDKADDWSLLEHLHPEQRQKSFGLGLSKSEANLTVSPFDGGKLPKGTKVGEPSTIFEEIGGLKRAKPRIIGEKGDAKLEDFANRILRPNPERARRRAVRKQKKAGRSGFNINEEGRPKGPGRIKKRINKARRAVKRTFGKERNESKITAGIQKGQTVRIFERDADGKVFIGKETIDLLNEVVNETAKAGGSRAGKGEFKGQQGANMLLGYLWENNGFNREATLVSEDELVGLIDAGWHPIKRGVQREDFAEEWLTSPIRRITGDGGEAEGPGEYWAHAVSSNWNSYWGGTVAKTGMVGLVSPDFKVASRADRERMALEHMKFAREINNIISAMPKGEAEKMEPADFMRELRAALAKSVTDGDPIWDGEVGQMWSSLMSAYESASGPEKAKLWNVMNFMSSEIQKIDPTNWSNYIPLILGYDAIDTGDNTVRTGGSAAGKQFLVFNRQGLAVLDRPTSLTEIDAILEKADKK